MITLTHYGQPNYVQFHTLAYDKYLNPQYNMQDDLTAPSDNWQFVNHALYGLMGGMSFHHIKQGKGSQKDQSIVSPYLAVSHLFWHMEDEDMEGLTDAELNLLSRQAYHKLYQAIITQAQLYQQDVVKLSCYGDQLDSAVFLGGWHISNEQIIGSNHDYDLYVCDLHPHQKDLDLQHQWINNAIAINAQVH